MPPKKTTKKVESLTNREYFAGIYMNAVLSKMTGHSNSGMLDLKKQAYEWADFMTDQKNE